MFRITKVQPLYKCNIFMVNFERVPFNIIEERMQNPRTLVEREREREREREHLCHCYACCLVTTLFPVQQTETMHEESFPLTGKKSKKEFHISRRFLMIAFLFGIFVWISAQTGVDNEINLESAKVHHGHNISFCESIPIDWLCLFVYTHWHTNMQFSIHRLCIYRDLYWVKLHLQCILPLYRV